MADAETTVALTNNTVALVQIYLLRGQLERHHQNLDVAEAYLQKGLRQIQGQQTPIQIAQFLAEFGITQTCHGQFVQGKKYLTDALMLARQEATASDLLLNLLAELGVLAFMGDKDYLIFKEVDYCSIIWHD